MKVNIKRFYCPFCGRLVRGTEHRNDGTINIHCSICGAPVWVWNGIYWKRMKKGN